jgi:hypothetical protein
MSSQRPNTNLSNGFLRPNVILCAGENADQLLQAVQDYSRCKFRETSEYRCYRFWTFDDFLLVWTGIGTGCIEPLLYELLCPMPQAIVNRIVLVGTAGQLPHTKFADKQSDCYWISKAYLGPSGVGSLLPQEPLVPRYSNSNKPLPHATIISTDLFYSFTKPGDIGDPQLRQRVEKFWPECFLIDMEVAQFYFLCARFTQKFQLHSLSYLAVKGPSNEVGNAAQQLKQTDAVLRACVRSGLDLLD